MNLKDSRELLYGSLQLLYPDGNAINYEATSGCTGWQRPEDQWARARGPLPEGFSYQIPTKPYWLDTRGIEGWFFHITPDPVGSGDLIRAELGIHFDANVPGSAGCIVLKNRSGWNRFCQRLGDIAARGVRNIPLAVKYG